MKKLTTLVASALVATTSLTSPAKADDREAQVRGFFKMIFSGHNVSRGDTQFPEPQLRPR